MRIKCTIIFLLSALCSFSQVEIDETSTWSFKDRGYFGIGFSGLGFGNDNFVGRYFTIGLSPQVGFMLTKNLSGGFGIEYQFTNYADLGIRDHVYGGYPFFRYNIRNFFVQADYDWISTDDLSTQGKDRSVLERFFVGLGYASSPYSRGSFNILLSYDLNYPDNYMFFGSPFLLRAFYTF